MASKSIIIDGFSIANHLISIKQSKDGKSFDPLVKDFIEHIRGQVTKHNPSKAIIAMPPVGVMQDYPYAAIQRIISALGLRQVTVEQSSVGPTISVLARQLAGEGQCVVVSGRSLSLSQLLSPDVFFQRFGDDNLLDEERLSQMIGLSSKQIPDLIAMIGDQDMALPSLIGSNTAISWLRNHGSLQGIMDNADQLPRAMRNELTKHAAEMQDRLFKASFANNEYEAIDIDLNSIDRQRIDSNNLYREYIDNKLFDWLPDDLRQKYTPKTSMGSETTYTKIVNNSSMMGDLMEKIELKKSCSVVINDRKPEGMAVSFQEGESWYIPLDSSFSSNWGMEAAKHILESEKIRKVTHNARDIYLWSLKRNIENNAILSDSAVLAYTIDSNESEKSLSELTQSHLNLAIRRDSQIYSKSKKKNSDEDMQSIAGFNGEKADAMWRLNRCLYKKATEDGAARLVFEKYERPLIGVLARMEDKGFRIDTGSLNEIGASMGARISEIIEKIKSVSGVYVNLNTPAKVADLLYEVLKLPILKRTGKGKPSTSEEALLLLSEKHEVPKLIMEYRSLSKLSSTYVDGLTNKVNSYTGRVHSTFMQNVAITGRLSNRDPNLQNIPIRSEQGRKIRRAFIPDNSDKYILAADYSQVELRILAHLSGDPGLVKAFNQGMDIHRATAADVFGVKPEDVTGEQRRSVKSINFGIVYGLSAHGLAKKLDVSVSEAKGYIQKYFDKYPGVKAFLDNTIKQAKKNGYVTTISGRKIYTPNINSEIKSLRASAERAAQNYPMQGSASDIIKLAMIEVEKELKKAGLGADMLLQVHDELVFEVEKSDVKQTHDIVKRVMESVVSLSVPLTVEADIGKNWEQSHSIDAKEHEEDLDVVLDI